MAELYSPGKRRQIQRVLLPLFHGLNNVLSVMVIDLTIETKIAGQEALGEAQGPCLGSWHTELPRTGKAPVAFWSGGDQKAYSLLESMDECFGKTMLTRGE